MPPGLSNLILTNFSTLTALHMPLEEAALWAHLQGPPAGYSPAGPISSFLILLRRPLLRKTIHILYTQNGPALIFLLLLVLFRAVIIMCDTPSAWSLMCHLSPQLNGSLWKVRGQLSPVPQLCPRPQHSAWHVKDTGNTDALKWFYLL